MAVLISLWVWSFISKYSIIMHGMEQNAMICSLLGSPDKKQKQADGISSRLSQNPAHAQY